MYIVLLRSTINLNTAIYKYLAPLERSLNPVSVLNVPQPSCLSK